MSTPAGWHNDPYGRFAKRYWDGSAWTAQVVSGDGAHHVDPLGVSTVVPFATPATAQGNPATPTSPPGGAAQGFVAMDDGGAASSAPPPPPSSPTPPPPPPPPAGGAIGEAGGSPAAAPTGLWGLLERMAPDSRRRPDPTLGVVLAGIGGLIVAIGLGVLIVGDDSSRSSTILAGLIITGVAVALRLAVRKPPEVASGAVGAGIVGLLALAVGIGVSPDTTSATWPMILIAIVFLAAWLLPGFFGRTIMLGISAFAVVAAAASALADDTGDRSLEFGGVRLDGQGYAFLLLGAALLGLVWWLDRRGYRGTATGLVAAGLLAVGIGASLLISEFGDIGGPLLSTGVGLLVCVVGSHGSRRATTWIGAAVTASGVIGLLANIFDPESSRSIGTTVLVAGIVLVIAAIVVSRWRVARANSSTP